MQTPPKFIMIGGFLGAGKTTTIARLAQHYRSEGKRVVIVTNDQAADLVDTLMLRSHGFDVGEVAGSCFCCNFNELTATVERLGAEGRPDVVIAEPVGSCTDLVATVIRPLETIYQQPFEIAPYGVIIKPSHGLKILGGGTGRGFSPQAEYIFLKQLEEADFILVNRIDEIAEEDADEIVRRVEERFPGVLVLRVSAKTGDAFDVLVDILNQPIGQQRRTMEVDYDVYAEGEAELGWLNAQVHLEANAAFAIDEVLMTLLHAIHQAAVERDAEIAHLKLIGSAPGIHAVANSVSNDTQPVLSLASEWQGESADLVVNARIAIDPAILEEIVREQVLQLQKSFGFSTAEITSLQSFRPGRPVPTHRLVD